MKSFFQFLSEAQSQASMQAKKLNLKSDGHGGWLNTRGKFVATTEDGKLKFVDKKKAKGEEDLEHKQNQKKRRRKKLHLKRLEQRKQKQVRVEKVLERLRKL
jgi:hypothetical protein